MTKLFGTSLLLASTLAVSAQSAFALQLVETGMQKNKNGTTTYHFAVKTDPGEVLTPGEDFVTVYNFYGLVHGSAKSPSGWSVSSQEFGKTPTWGGYPAVVPVDIPGTPNLTWTPSATIDGGTEIDGFSAITHEAGTTSGMYSAQLTRTEEGQSDPSKQAVVGQIATPRFLVK
jgi:hypothetical protein